MPYINPNARRELDRCRVGTIGDKIDGVGELTYVFYRIAVGYMEDKDESYAWHAEVIAALDNAKEEYRRMQLDPYENNKRLENGSL